MAELTTKRRNNLPESKFAGPDRSYPVDTKARAANAKARSTQAVNAGRMSESQKEKIDAKANKVLDKGKDDKPSKDKKGDPPKGKNDPQKVGQRLGMGLGYGEGIGSY